MASFVFNKAKEKFSKGEIDWEDDTFRAFIVNAEPDRDSDEFVSDVSGSEVGAVSRKTLANTSVSTDSDHNVVVLDADDITFETVTLDETLAGVVIYKQVGGDDTTPGDDDLICFIDTVDKTGSGLDVDFNFSEQGVIRF